MDLGYNVNVPIKGDISINFYSQGIIYLIIC